MDFAISIATRCQVIRRRHLATGSGLLAIIVAVLAFALIEPDTASRPALSSVEAAKRLTAAIEDESDPARLAVLRGLRWLSAYLDPPERLDAVFSDYVLALHELTRDQGDEVVASVAEGLLRASFQRAGERLDRIFPATASGEWDFISILELLYHYRLAPEPYAAYHRRVLAGRASSEPPGSFSAAYRARDYDRLGDLLINHSFLHRFIATHPDHGLELPRDRFEDWVRIGAGVPAVHRFASDAGGYHDQNYYFTHVVLVLTGYGATPVADPARRERLLGYLREQFPVVIGQVGDLDLVGEFSQCFKLLGASDAPEIERATRFLLARQNPDGSWGGPDDFAGTTYDAIHPTWTALTALIARAPAQTPQPIWRRIRDELLG